MCSAGAAEDGRSPSISWPRILPDGAASAHSAGIAFYDRLIDELLAHGVAPWVTLYHWDMPNALMKQGGWLDRSTVDAFANYVVAVADALGDRVAAWITLNEPVVHTGFGYALGTEAPGLTLLGGAFQAAHHQLLAHARAVEILRDTTGLVGIVNNHTLVRPASESDADMLAAGMYEIYHNAQYAQPVLAGSYPEALQMLPGASWDCIKPGDMQQISAPLDFYGVNYYQPTLVAAAPDDSDLPFTFVTPDDVAVTDFGWPIDPAALTELLVGLRSTYPGMPAVYITENGCAYDDVVGPDRSLHDDAARIDYLNRHLDAVADSISAGVDLRGYFHWSLIDNWEWAEGFTRRFGLVRVDFDTLARTPRALFAYYRDLIAENRLAAGCAGPTRAAGCRSRSCNEIARF